MNVTYPRHHDPELADYLAARTVAVSSGCWHWCLSLNEYGYGQAKYFYGTRNAHRHAFYVAHGHLPPAPMVVRHTCDNRRCCNPAHLIAGSVADNNRDKMLRGRHRPPLGEAHGCAKLTNSDIIAIRASARRPTYLALEYGVTRRTIRAIQQRTSWKHIPEGGLA